MSKQVKISKIGIDINNKKLELSLKEARELKKILEELFPEPIREKEYIPWYPVVAANWKRYSWAVTTDSKTCGSDNILWLSA
jgi:hypothetical protein